MTEPKFTPGEWEVDKYMLPKGRIDYSICVNEQNGNIITIATVYGDDERPERGIADAHLIAAAPEMYRKLEWIMRQFDNSEDETLVALGWEIEDLLKKARGEK